MAKEDDKKQEGDEQFIAVETDDEGRPLNQQAADVDDQELDEGEDDERAGHAEGEQSYRGPANESVDEKRARRKRERKAQHIRQRVAAQAKDRTINSQVEQIHQLIQRVARLEGRSTSVDMNLLQNQLNSVEQQQRDAKSTLAALAKAEDWAGVAEVTDIQHQLRDQQRHLRTALQQAQAGPQGGQAESRAQGGSVEARPQPAAQTVQAPSHVTVALAETWAEEHSWYDPKRNPEDTAIVTAIDSVVSREGFDPETPEYWEELTRRVQKRLPHRFKGAAADAGPSAPAKGPKMAPASQNGPQHRTLRPNEVYISPARKKAMTEAGIWDDPKRRAKMLKTYAEYDKSNA